MKGLLPPSESTHPTPHIVTFFFLVRTFTFYSLSKFQLYNTMLSTIATILYIRFSDLIHFTTESLYSRSNLYFCPPIQTLISSRNTLTDPPKIMYNQIAGHSMSPPSCHIKVSITTIKRKSNKFMFQIFVVSYFSFSSYLVCSFANVSWYTHNMIMCK